MTRHLFRRAKFGGQAMPVSREDDHPDNGRIFTHGGEDYGNQLSRPSTPASLLTELGGARFQ